MMRKAIVILLFIGLLFLPTNASAADIEPPVIIEYGPEEGKLITNNTPVIYAIIIDDDKIDLASYSVFVDDTDVTWWEITTVNETGFSYSVPSIIPLAEGNHTVVLSVSDEAGNVLEFNWTFEVNTTAGSSIASSFDIQGILVNVIIVSGLAGAGFVGYIYYLRRTKNFTFRKYFVQNPIKKGYLIVALPLLGAFVTSLIGLSWISSQVKPDPFSYEYVFIAALMVGVFPFAIDSQIEKKRKANYERAFAQFLFELADAIRGGIDPAKAVVEFSKVDRSIMKKNLKAAADGIRIGRPFEEMLTVMTKPMRSDLISRYASLIGESSKIGGDISVVIHRAAQDMDELIKIEEERRRQLMMQATTIYISFGVLVIVVYQLIDIYPTLGTIDTTGFGQSGLEGKDTAAASTKMTFETLKRRFFHLVLINSITAGCLIGAFTEGKVRMGLVHALLMILVTTIFFVLMVFPK